MEELKFILGSKKNPIIVHLSHFEGRPLIDIRKYFIDKDDSAKFSPTKKGISLNQIQLQQLEEILEINKVEITNFFNGQLQLNGESGIRRLVERPLIGRSFNVEFNGNEINVNINQDLVYLKQMNSEELLPFLMEAFHRSAMLVIEDSTEFENLMNSLNKLLKIRI
jgi:hypothetical protein